MSNDSEKDEIRRRVDIVELVSERVKLKRAGQNFTGLCPFHNDKKPSFTVNPGLQFYKCWSCGASGDIFKWVMETQRVDFKEAITQLAAKAGITLTRNAPKKDDEPLKAAMQEALDFFVLQLTQNKEATQYAASRNLDQNTLQEFEIGFAPKNGDALARHLQRAGHNLQTCRELFLIEQDQQGGYYDRFRSRLMFPIRDERGDLVAFGGRTTVNDDRKYINSSDTPLYHKSRVLYGMNRAKPHIAKSRTAVLVEGYLDVIACHRSEVNTAIATLGTSLAEEHVKMLKRWCDKVIVLYDSDPAGQKAAERACDLCEAAELIVKVALMPQGDDPDSLLKSQGPQAVAAGVDRAMPAFDFRISMFRGRNTPTDEHYWEEAVKTLAKAPNELELIRVLPSFAAEYPHGRDTAGKMSAIRTMVVREKRRPTPLPFDRGERNGEKEEEQPVVKAVVEIRYEPWLGPEKTVFRSLLRTPLIPHVVEALRDPCVLITTGAKAAALSVLAIFEPHRLPSEWLGDMENETLKGLVAEALMDPGPLSLEGLQDAVTRLKEMHHNRETKEITETAERDDDGLRLIQERLRQLKGQPIEKDELF